MSWEESQEYRDRFDDSRYDREPQADCIDCGWEGSVFDLITGENDDDGTCCPDCGSDNIVRE